ncbi:MULTISPECIES: VWA domain-containing protein [unclassified Pseudomonas]|uniref:VWA domain-containing protein n=1 Tax=unclassified Pseudomonas TaxID=196821 RepID=UPI000BD73B43|nr:MULTISPECIES: VWA domain-containing protein [unclassified Pseudomonas]PVZ20333.1 Ca-activated chloride channel family protein [Pseudomonas sp. URIL14HWK12:I12]PVZ27399.1 Ca-activated chloride channel family protein [Pseudomonas sp. URIL14HWK12:I10]PVZ38288.1 Ca-activated chloride channel family protein [Pseudomonas sp. URIL14HWK12:I11]SNZ03950.1 Ca-activated chloride channel family protein [Pseudomonas sp. URIL14HWK12:I9]
MSDLWPHWARLGWLLTVPVLMWLLARHWRRQQRTGRWHQLLPQAFHQALLSAGRGRGARWHLMLLGLGWALALLALMGPGWQRLEQVEQKPGDPLVVMLQLTPEILATDVAPNRLAQARRKLLDLLRNRADAQTAIVVYAGSAHVLVPLSNDLATASNLLDALKPSLMPAPGQRADLAVAQAQGLLAQAGQGQGRLLLVTSALSDQERAGIDHLLGRQSPPLLILGIGTPDGAPVKLEDGQLLKDSQGAIALPRLDAGELARFAEHQRGYYQSARVDDHDLRALGLFDNTYAPHSASTSQRLEAWADQGYWLLLPLLLIAALGARRGWLLCLLPLLLAAPHPAMAQGWGDLWLRPDQQGQRLLEANRPAEAARRFTDHRWQGMALFEAGDYASAAQQFARGDTAADHYNRGTALARAGQLEAALDAYDQALERQPDLAQALKNRAIVQQLLDERHAQQAAGGPPAEEPTSTGHEAANAGASGMPPGPNGQPADAQPGEAASQVDAASSEGGGQAAGDALAALQRGDDQALPETASPAVESERQQSLEQWLRQIPDDPSELLRRKFWYEQQQQQDTPP